MVNKLCKLQKYILKKGHKWKVITLQMSSSDEGSTMLQPGQLIRPQTTEDNARELALELYGLTVSSVKELVSYDDRNYWIRVEQEYNNPNITELWPHGYMLKILNSMDSQKTHVGEDLIHFLPFAAILSYFSSFTTCLIHSFS